ncbi:MULTISPECIES: hypothetical protein [unclassified Archaeoglobus]|uniref:hypothetical protein n=1 Tax=unclassified Archaeoglobus TaxID=2643606 RepID=UPI0025BCFD1F|nr:MULTISPECIES: hypothetical protein [unclassified Archaeoglobus]
MSLLLLVVLRSGVTAGMGSLVGVACNYWCTGNVDPCSGGFCAGTCSAICIRLVGPELAYLCEKYACVPACTGACEVVC